jgi:hypothetical protein
VSLHRRAETCPDSPAGLMAAAQMDALDDVQILAVTVGLAALVGSPDNVPLINLTRAVSSSPTIAAARLTANFHLRRWPDNRACADLALDVLARLRGLS